MKFKGFYLLIFFLLCGLGCHSAPPKKMNALAVGMPRRDVLLLMGTPAWMQKEENKEIFAYRLRKSLSDPYAAPDKPYWVFLRDGKVVMHGRGEDFKSADPEMRKEILEADIRFTQK